MRKKVEQTIDEYSLLENKDTLVVALSGGPDSCALLLSLIGLSAKWRLKLVVAHFNHGLRESQSDEEQVFCGNLAQKFDLAFITDKMQSSTVPRGLSPEDYFRRERYSFLNRVATEYGANKIALGHHLNDQAETVLNNLLRGSGLDGLKGILPIRDGKYIRPLLKVSRREILAYLEAEGIPYCEDRSNESIVYLRNRIRNELLPYLRENYNPRIENSLAKMSEIVRRDDDFINEHVKRIMTSSHIERETGKVSFSAKYFKTLHASLRFRLIKSLLEAQAPEAKGFSLTHIQALTDMTMKETSGKLISLPGGLMARKDYDRIIIESGEIAPANDYEYPINIPGTLDLSERGITLSLRRDKEGKIDFNNIHQTYFDEDKVRGPLIIRNRRRGDRFEPLGTKGSQKVKKLFIDRKVPGRERSRIALLADQESVIWIENLHQSDRTKVTSSTQNLLILEIHRKS